MKIKKLFLSILLALIISMPCFAETIMVGDLKPRPYLPIAVTDRKLFSADRVPVKPPPTIKPPIVPPVVPPVDPGSATSALLSSEALRAEKFIPQQVAPVQQVALQTTNMAFAGAAAPIRHQKNTILVGHKGSDNKIMYYEIINQ